MSSPKTRALLVAASAWALAVAACNVYADPVDNGTAAGNTPTPVSSAFASDPNGVNPSPSSCPVDRPTDDTQCDTVGSVCEYGDTPDITCNPRVECVASGPSSSGASLPPAWSTGAAVSGCVAHTCPSLFSDITAGAACDAPADAGSAAEYLCAYPEGLCGCSTGPDGTHAHARRWDCAPPPPSPCPVARPRIGQACATLGETCDYGSCLFKHGTAVRCDGTTWQATEVPCN